MANKKNKEINHNNLVTIKSITDNQKVVFDSWKKGQNQFLFGAAGTGKTFISLYLALKDVMDLKKRQIEDEGKRLGNQVVDDLMSLLRHKEDNINQKRIAKLG